MHLRRAIWERIEELIESAPADGINAEGEFNEKLRDWQSAYLKGMRVARVAAMNVVASEAVK